MQGHSAVGADGRGDDYANYIPVVASNRVGKEFGDNSFITFYGTSFITDPTGAIVTDASGRRGGG